MAAKKKVGRRPKLTREAVESALKLKKGGANNKDIAAALGVCPQTFYRWIGEPKTDLQRELRDGLKKAEADYKNALQLIIMRDAKERDWKAAAWLLERKYPDEFSRRDRINAQVEQTTQATVKCELFFDYGEDDAE